jgi:hypothetical protein
MSGMVDSSYSGFNFITRLVYSIITFLLLIVIYSYIDSLEKKGCKCALPSNINFVKNYTIFAIVYFLFNALIPQSFIIENFGASVSIFATFLDLIFNLVFIYYIYEVFKYTRALVNEKCKCSIDSRREIIMTGAIIEFILIFLVFLANIFIAVGLGAGLLAVKSINDGAQDLSNAIHDPIGSLTKVPERIKTTIENINTYIEKTSEEISNLGSSHEVKSIPELQLIKSNTSQSLNAINKLGGRFARAASRRY